MSCCTREGETVFNEAFCSVSSGGRRATLLTALEQLHMNASVINVAISLLTGIG